MIQQPTHCSSERAGAVHVIGELKRQRRLLPVAERHVRRQPALPITKKESRTMAALGGMFFVVYIACVIALVIYVLRLLGRFVSAHERVASSLDIIARKMRDDAKP